MIVKDGGSYFELITQHEHARLSFEVVKEWGDDAARKDPFWDAIVTAVREHDRAWIPLDASPLMDEKHGRPYSFTDYPEREKIQAYQRGINELAEKNIYSGLLSSLHFTSFYKGTDMKEGKKFLENECERQARLLNKVEGNPDENFHLKILQFCDDISLYLCMNEPGAKKEEEVSWFKKGFRHTFPFVNDQTIIPHFLSKREVKLSPFPLKREAEVSMKSTIVMKKDMKSKGLPVAYNTGTTKETSFFLTN